MYVNIEFFDAEPIENLITCLNFKMDKVVFFGHDDVMTKEKQEQTRKILNRLCGIFEVVFHTVSKKDLQSIVSRMQEVLLAEKKENNECFFDLTGGEDLILVAMGILSTMHQTPMHQFDIEKNKLHILNERTISGIDALVPQEKIELNLDDIIGFQGGIIDYRHHKLAKDDLGEEEFERQVEAMWKIASRNPRKWNAFSYVLKGLTHYEDESFRVRIQKSELEQIGKRSPEIENFDSFMKFAKQLEKEQLLWQLEERNGSLSFSYFNEKIRDCLLDAGCILELATYFERKKTGEYTDCKIGVHIDWNGKFEGPGIDVENEVDVMLLSGYIPVFISCKNGKVDQMALYELDTVARRFGGKYVKKELMATQEIANGYIQRAEEMGIQISSLN